MECREKTWEMEADEELNWKRATWGVFEREGKDSVSWSGRRWGKKNRADEKLMLKCHAEGH